MGYNSSNKAKIRACLWMMASIYTKLTTIKRIQLAFLSCVFVLEITREKSSQAVQVLFKLFPKWIQEETF